MHSFNSTEFTQPTFETSLDELLDIRARGKLKKAQPIVVSSLGTAVPEVPHAVSVCMPSWKDNVDYEEGDPRVHNKLQSGYPRFCFHSNVKLLTQFCHKWFSLTTDQLCLIFPSQRTAELCLNFITHYYTKTIDKSSQIDLNSQNLFFKTLEVVSSLSEETLNIYVVCYPSNAQQLAKTFWQHSGEIISSRFAEAALSAISLMSKYKSASSEVLGPTLKKPETEDADVYIEEYFGRNLPSISTPEAKKLIRERLASFSSHAESDIYLFPTGMNSIFTAHRVLLSQFSKRKSVMFGFPYLDTLKILQKFGPGVHFLGYGDDSDLVQLETLLSSEPILAVFCEFPSNPLCKSPNLPKISELVKKYNSFLVVDDTIGNSFNCTVHKYADIVATSLTKLFSGESNVMGGSLTISKYSERYQDLKQWFSQDYQDHFFSQDAIFLERNSRDFTKRAITINQNAERLCDFLHGHPKVKQLFYPKYITRENYDVCKTPNGGFGGLFSIVFHNEVDGRVFFDNLPVSKGPSLGTNFTLCCPYTILAHYTELEFAEQFGIASSLVRVSVGLEDIDKLLLSFSEALKSLE